MCEVKIQEGARLDEFEIDGYVLNAFLRPDHPEGGIMIWSKLRSGYDIQVCEYLSTPEKVWVKVRSGAHCFGLCQVYLRTNKGRDHQYFRDNTLLLESLRDDSAWFHSQGYGVILAGDT